jgi:hypothetical protein
MYRYGVYRLDSHQMFDECERLISIGRHFYDLIDFCKSLHLKVTAVQTTKQSNSMFADEGQALRVSFGSRAIVRQKTVAK